MTLSLRQEPAATSYPSGKHSGGGDGASQLGQRVGGAVGEGGQGRGCGGRERAGGRGCGEREGAGLWERAGAGLRGEGGRGWGSGRVVGPHLYSWRRLGRSSVLRK